MLIVFVLFISYFFEVIKGERSLLYMIVFMVFTAMPAFVIFFIYLAKRDSKYLRYQIVIGYFSLYTFVMFTGSTNLVFCYILPMLSLLVLYHEPKIILWTGIGSISINIACMVIRFVDGEINTHNSKDLEIQFALLFLCFLGSYIATTLYDEINKKNIESTKELEKQWDQLQNQAKELERMNEEIKLMTKQTITAIANTIDAKDEYTKGHSKRVSVYSAAIARELGKNEKEIQDIEFIGLLHDIGKIGIPDSVLNKPGRLTDEEYEVMRSHTIVGSEILKDVVLIDGLEIGAKYHHERYDGKGYPDGLKGEEIPFIARIIAVADAYDAMSSNRVYRKHLPPEKVLEELKNGMGTQWDASCTQAMINIIEEGKIPVVDEKKETQMIQETTTILTRVIDAAEEKYGESKLELDGLTGTYGREMGEQIIQETIGKYGKGMLMLFDIDAFHKINDKMGFVVGDLYLRTLVDTIRKVSDKSIISRFGSDDFLVYFYSANSEEEGKQLVEEFYGLLRERVKNSENLYQMSVSVGMTEVITEKDRVMVLYENTVKALYVAKQHGGNRYYFHRIFDEDYDPEKVKAIDLRRLVSSIKSREKKKGGLLTAYPEFERMYDYIANVAKRNEQKVQIVLFTMLSNTGVRVSIEERDRVMNLLQNAIVGAIRNVDVTARYSSNQIILLLINLTYENTNIVVERIMKEFYKTYDKREITIHYDKADLEAEKEK